MRDNIVASYSHDDREVRNLVFFTFFFSFVAGVSVGTYLALI